MGFDKKNSSPLQSNSFLHNRSFLFSSLEETELANWAKMPQVTKEMKAAAFDLKSAAFSAWSATLGQW